MQGRWKSLPEPVPSFGMLGDVQFNIWNPNIWQLAGSGMDIPAGEKEKLDIAIRFDDEQDAFGWSNASYQPPTLWRNPKWKLGKGRHVVTVTVRAGGQKWTDAFELNNDGRRDELRLTRKT